MARPKRTFTYRQGKKVELATQPDELVVRLRPDEIEAVGIDTEAMEQVSSQSTRVKVKPAELEKKLKEMRSVAPTHRSYKKTDTGAEFLITDRLFVTFAQPPSEAELGDFLADYALVLLDRYSNVDVLVQLTDHTGMSPVDLVVRLTEDEPRVRLVEHDLNRRGTKAVVTPTDPQYLRQWFLHTRSQSPQFDARASSRCELAWERLGGFGSAEVVVGVSDDGCRLDHPDFSDRKFAAWGYFDGRRLVVDSDIDAVAARMYQTGDDHGSACAGVIAGEVDGVLTVGAAPGVKLLPIKWETLDDESLSITDSKMMSLLAFVADRVDVLSNSWSNVPEDEWATQVVARIRDLALTGGRRGGGILFLFAAGNDNCPIAHTAARDVPYTDGWDVRADGSAVWVGPETARRFVNNLVGVPGVAHIGALASTAQRSHYSNYGTGILLCAPTNNVHSFYRDVVRGLSVTTVSGTPALVTHQFGGTSSATPLVAGVAALVISANPRLTAVEVLSVLKRTASRDLDLSGYRRTPPTGYDPNPTWDVSPVAPFDDGAFVDGGDPEGSWSPWFGFGRVDAADAVAEALRLTAGQPPVVVPAMPVELASSPNRAIPDGSGAIEDVIHVAEGGPLTWIEVTLDIRHTKIGDLLVRLVAPDGTRALLHNRTGGDDDDIGRSYDPDNRKALADLVGKETSGDWTLHVEDRKPRSKGRLVSWALKITRGAAAGVATDTQRVPIPDGDPGGVTRAVTLAAGRAIRTVTVGVEITHPWLPDLALELVPPFGAALTLPLGRAGAGGKLKQRWSDQDLPALATLRGRDQGGEWKLRVADTTALDAGTLDSWSLEVTG